MKKIAITENLIQFHNRKLAKQRLGGLLGVTLSFCLPVLAYGQGSLTPPGPPAPTMKTLQQVEPRTDVLTLPGSGSAQYVISVPGSYYLTTNILGIAGASKVGILITANDVTLDLNGFAAKGNGSLFSGIWLYGPNGVGATNVTILNGSICGWINAGIWADGSANCRFERLTLANNGLEGVRGVSDSLVANCIAQANGSRGVYAGIAVVDRCYVQNNDCSGNTEGIIATGAYNRIESNHLINNGTGGLSYGIVISANKYNLVVRNTAGSSFGTSNYVLASGNTWGPIVILGFGAIAGAANSTGWENFDNYLIY